MLDRLAQGFEIPTSLHRRRLARAPLTPLTSPGRAEVTPPPTAAAGEYEETLPLVPRRGPAASSRWIEELLGLGAHRRPQEPEPAKPIPVSEIVEAAVAAVRAEAERRGVTVAVERPPELLVNAAPGAAKVALANILDNAVKFSPTGGKVRIVVTAGREDVVHRRLRPPDRASRHRRWQGCSSASTGAKPRFRWTCQASALALRSRRHSSSRQGGRISVEARAERGATFSVHFSRA